MTFREQQIQIGADAIRARATWPSMHWPDRSALTSRDVAIAMATAVLDAVQPSAPVPSADAEPTADDALFELRTAATSDRYYMSSEGFEAALARVVSERGPLASPAQVTLDRMAQRFYEVVTDGPAPVRGLSSNKPLVVEALRAALAYGREIEAKEAPEVSPGDGRHALWLRRARHAVSVDLIR